jgi:hypothetical protein
MRAKHPGTLEDLFAGRPTSPALFVVVRRSIESFGPAKVEATKTQQIGRRRRRKI